MVYYYMDIYDLNLLLPTTHSPSYTLCSWYHDAMGKCGHLQGQALYPLVE